MATTKIFKSGNSQAVRIPREFHLHCKEVEIFRSGSDIILREKPRNLLPAFNLLGKLSKDFFRGGRRQPKPQKRANL